MPRTPYQQLRRDISTLQARRDYLATSLQEVKTVKAYDRIKAEYEALGRQITEMEFRLIEMKEQREARNEGA